MKTISKLFYRLSGKSQKLGDYFNKTLVDEPTWNLRMMHFKANVAMIVSFITLFYIWYKL